MVQAYSGPHGVQELEGERKHLSWEEAGTCPVNRRGKEATPVSVEGEALKMDN